MTDRALLEAAAKAAGIPLKPDFAERFDYYMADPLMWNPLTDDGDALRLAVKLRLNIMQGDYSCGVNDEREIDVVEAFAGQDHCSVIRRCIVRAAAEMAK
jgi:hypothetical protein